LTTRLVLDASIALAWCFEDETGAYSDGILDLLTHDAEAVVPAIWPLEVGNALLAGERRRRLTAAATNQFLDRLTMLPILIDAPELRRTFEAVLRIARETGLTSYDAAYLALALRQRLPLASLDKGLIAAARRANAETVVV
jgi:predicted nucleic acid-binding protein